MKNHVKDFFSFSKKERTGIVILLVLILSTTLFIFFLPISSVLVDPGELLVLQRQYALLAELKDSTGDRWNEQRAGGYGGGLDSGQYSGDAVLFAFDPNTLPADDWKRLGLRDKTIATIQHYIAKGGRFRKPEDLCRIYGLRREDCVRLLPFVQLPVAKGDAGVASFTPSAQYPSVSRFNDTSSFARRNGWKERSAPAIIDINTADTTAFIALRGIGSKLAMRIVHFREKLGGFYRVEQVGETYGLPDSTFQQIRALLQCNAPVVRSVNINTAGADSLKLHPYISWQVANAIVQFRLQHGAFRSVDQLLQINIITPEILAKAGPYLTTGEGR
jgi:competence ComEA-like helix-hairpin-helix protein